jgi:hypothetical protein
MYSPTCCWGNSLQLHPASPASTQLPGNVAAARDANDLAPDLLLNDWSLRNQTEAEPVINHREPPACELHGTKQFAAESLSLLNGMEGKGSLRRELPTDALNFLTAQGVEEVGSRPEFAGGRPPALTPPDELVFALLERIQGLATKSAFRNRAAIGIHDVLIQPSCAIARHLLVKIEGREHSHAETGSARGVILGGAGLEVLGNPPPVSVEPLNNPGRRSATTDRLNPTPAMAAMARTEELATGTQAPMTLTPHPTPPVAMGLARQ